MKLYVLFETDSQMSKSSRIFLGVFTSKQDAINNAKLNRCYTYGKDAEIVEIELNKFSEI